MDHKLGDSLALLNLDGVMGIQIYGDNLELSPVMGIDKARRVGHRETLLERHAAPGLDESRIALGNGDSQPC